MKHVSTAALAALLFFGMLAACDQQRPLFDTVKEDGEGGGDASATSGGNGGAGGSGGSAGGGGAGGK